MSAHRQPGRHGLTATWFQGGRGAYIIRVSPGSPAAEAGLVPSGSDPLGSPRAGGDIIVAIDGTPVDSGADLTARINRHRAGEIINLTVVRQGKTINAPVTLGEWPAN